MPPTAHGDVDSVSPSLNLTRLLVATWFNLLVYTFELNLGVYFLSISSRKSVRTIVGIALVLETMATAMVCIHGYNHFFLYHDAIEAAYSWNLPIISIFTNLSIGAEQLYFTHRFWTLSRNGIAAGIISVSIILRVIFILILMIYSRVTVYAHVVPLTRAAIVAATLSVVTDIVIAVISVWKMKKIRTAYDSTQNLLKKMMIYAVTCGILTALCTVVSIIITYVSLDAFNILFFAIGRIYTLTILLNLMIIRGPGSGPDDARDLPETSPQVLQPNSIDLRNLPTPRHSMIVSGHATTCDDFIDETGRYKRPPPAPAFSMDSI
ncbi:hypothetical protein PM082_007620 [Marasmius tenuissimus]|nr:hypothetical protein PM082_007620 [Marasmius tenuissimus]